jgi:hypothetical protein
MLPKPYRKGGRNYPKVIDVQSYDFWVTYIRKVLPKKVGGIGWCRRCVEGRKVRRRYNISRKGG